MSLVLLASVVDGAALGVPPGECSPARTAHERLLAGSFHVERTFRISVNGDLKRREVAHLSYRAGELETEVRELEVLSKSMVFEGEGKDFALAVEFDCERLEVVKDGYYELTSEDGFEVAEFRLDEKTSALVPLSWRLATTERFLFKKFVMAGRAEYQRFSWMSPDE